MAAAAGTAGTFLPVVAVPDKTPGIFGPDYSFADNVKLPGQVGVRKGDDMSSVIDALKATTYYIDTIGFGESSSGLSQGLGVKPLGVNTWIQTGLECSNGATMWMYNEGIPTGHALGKRVSDGLASAGLPGLRGLAPGIVEDAESALDPRPIMAAVFGPSHPVCRLTARQVGDQDGRIQNPDTKAYFVENRETVYMDNGVPMQRRWEQDDRAVASQGTKPVKTHCPDGYLIKNHTDGKCDGKLLSTKEAFSSSEDLDKETRLLVLTTVAGAGILVLIAALRLR